MGDASTAKEAVRGVLGRHTRVLLTDGRVVEGTLDCMDNSGNLVLSDAADVSDSSRRAHRLGLVMVPGGVQIRVWVSRADVGRLASAVAEGVVL